MSFTGSELGLKVYIEGVLIPVIGVQTTFTEGQAAAAEIRTVPTSSFHCIKPRSMVHIFYLTANTEEDTGQFYSFTQGDRLNSDPGDYPTIEDGVINTSMVEHLMSLGKSEAEATSAARALGSNRGNIRVGRRYKLLFSGEYVSYAYAKTTGGRVLVLQCRDATNYLDSLKQHGSNYKSGGFEQIENSFLGVQRDKDNRTFIGKDLSENLTKWLTTTKHYEINENSATEYDPNAKSDTAINTESHGTNYGGWKKTKTTNVITGLHRAILTSFCVGNIFYSKQMNRHRLPDTLVGLRGDTSADTLFDVKSFKKWLKRRVASGRGQHKTMAQVFRGVMNTILYTTVTIPSPKMIRGYHRGEQVKPYNDWTAWKNEGKRGGLGSYNNGPLREYHKGSSINMFLVKPDFWFFPPPACNIIFPDQYSSFSYGRNFIQEPTRMLMRTETMIKSGGGKRHTRNTYSSRSLTSGVIYSSTSYTSSGSLKYLAERTYAPDFKAFSVLLNKKVGWRANLHSVILPHEKFVGPNTLFTWEGDMGAFGSKSARADYLRMFTDYLFWKMYFGQRQGQLEMVFSPQIVPGFSCLIMDDIDVLPRSISPFTADADKAVYGSHHFAQVISVTHDIGQAGATTRLALAACRRFDEDIDFDAQTSTDSSVTSKPFEDIVVRPMRDYFDARYHCENIGRQFYYPILGCESLIEKVGGLESQMATTNPDGSLGEVLRSGESKNSGGTLSFKDCVKRLEYLYRLRFVEGPLQTKATVSTFTNPHAGDTIVDTIDKNSFIKFITERKGLVGEKDAIGQDIVTYGLYYLYEQRGGSKDYLNESFEGVGSDSAMASVHSVKDSDVAALQEKGISSEKVGVFMYENSDKAIRALRMAHTLDSTEDVGFYEPSVNPYVRNKNSVTAAIDTANSNIPDTVSLRGFTSKIPSTSEPSVSRDSEPCYFEQKRFISGSKQNTIPAKKYVPTVPDAEKLPKIEGIDEDAVRAARIALLGSRSEEQIIINSEAGAVWSYKGQDYDMEELAQIQTLQEKKTKSNTYSVKIEGKSYNLRQELEERRNCVTEFVNSLILKGIKG